MFTKLRKSGSRVISSFTFWVLFLLVCVVATFFIMLANEPAIARFGTAFYSEFYIGVKAAQLGKVP